MGVRSGPKLPDRSDIDVITEDGTFNSSAGWQVTPGSLGDGDNWSISGGSATIDGSQSGDRFFYMDFPQNNYYKLIITMTRAAGTLSLSYSNGTVTSGTEMTTSGTYTHTHQVTANDNIYIKADSSFSGTITNVKAIQTDSSGAPVSHIILCLDAGLNRSTSAMADAGHPTKGVLTYGGPGVEEDYQPTGCKLITRADKTIVQGNDLRAYDSNTQSNWAGPATGAGALFTKVSGSSANGFFGYLNTGYGFTSNPVVGRRYRLLVRAKSSSSIHLRFYDGAGAYHYFSADVGTTLKTYTFDFTCLHATGAFIYGTSSFSDGETVYFDRYEVYELTPWLDVSGHGGNGTPEGIDGLTIEDGTDKRGQGLKYFDLDGTDGQVKVTHYSDLITAKTWILWFKLDSIPANDTMDSIFQHSDNWNNAGGISLQMIYGNFTWSWGTNWGGSCSIANSTLSTGVWYHFVGTSNGTTGSEKVKMYLNGEIKDTGTAAQIPDDTPTHITIGNGNGGFTNGQIAAFQVYTAELTHAQIKDMYNSQRSRFGL